MDGDCGDFAGCCGWVYADIHDGFAVSEEGPLMRAMESFSDDDFKRTILRALRLLVVVTVVAAPLVWWELGWQSAVLLLVGALISGAGLFGWLRLITAVMVPVAGRAEARAVGGGLAGCLPLRGTTPC